MSANITVSVRTEPPGRGSTPSRTSILTRSAGIYFRKAAKPPAMSAMALDRLASSVTREGWRRTWPSSNRSTCLTSSMTVINGLASRRRASQADRTAAAATRTARPTSKWRIVVSTGPRNSASGITDAAFENAVGPRDFHHFEAEIAQFMGGEKGAVGPTERHPGYARLRLQLREKDKLPLVRLACLQHVLNE